LFIYFTSVLASDPLRQKYNKQTKLWQERKRIWKWGKGVIQFYFKKIHLHHIGVTKNFDWEVRKIEKLYFAIISLKNHNLAKLRNFRSPKSKIKGHWGRRAHST